jgi:hypothetical protein
VRIARLFLWKYVPKTSPHEKPFTKKTASKAESIS